MFWYGMGKDSKPRVTRVRVSCKDPSGFLHKFLSIGVIIHLARYAMSITPMDNNDGDRPMDNNNNNNGDSKDLAGIRGDVDLDLDGRGTRPLKRRWTEELSSGVDLTLQQEALARYGKKKEEGSLSQVAATRMTTVDKQKAILEDIGSRVAQPVAAESAGGSLFEAVFGEPDIDHEPGQSVNEDALKDYSTHNTTLG